MDRIRVFFEDSGLMNFLTFDKVKEYKIDKGFLCMSLNDGKSICYNIKNIEKFEVDMDENDT